MNWFTKQRQAWILETLEIFGYINREHIMKKFGVSIAQAANDLAELQRDNPRAVVYNTSTKRYERRA